MKNTKPKFNTSYTIQHYEISIFIHMNDFEIIYIFLLRFGLANAINDE